MTGVQMLVCVGVTLALAGSYIWAVHAIARLADGDEHKLD
jgi:hypothetical protein